MIERAEDAGRYPGASVMEARVCSYYSNNGLRAWVRQSLQMEEHEEISASLTFWARCMLRPCMCGYGVYLCWSPSPAQLFSRSGSGSSPRLRFQWWFSISAAPSSAGAPIRSQQSGPELFNGLPACQSRGLIPMASSPCQIGT